MCNNVICAGCFAGGEIEPGTFHGGDVDKGTFHCDASAERVSKTASESSSAGEDPSASDAGN